MPLTTTPSDPRAGFRMAVHRLWRYARRYLPWFLAAVAATVILNFASLIRPHLLKILTDEVLTGKSLDGKTTLLVSLLAGLLGATFLKGIFTYVQGYSLSNATQATVRDLREDVYEHVQHLPIPWFDRNRVGDILIRFTDDLRGITEFMTSGLMSFCNDTLVLVTSLAWMMTKDWKLTDLGMLVSPLAGMAVRRFSARLSHATQVAQQSLSNLSSLVQETLSGIKVVKAFNKETHEGDRFSRHNEDSFRWAMRIVQYTATQSPIVEVIATLGISLVLWYCAVHIITGELTLGDLLAFWAYMLMATTPINRLPQTMTTIERGCTAVERVMGLREARSEEEEAAALRQESGGPVVCTELPPVSGCIEIKDLSFRYADDGPEALRDIDLRIQAGEHIAIVGRNGAGKSTLLSLLPRFYELQKGDILLDGTSIRSVTLESLRLQIGVVPQETFLFSGSIRDNIRYGRLEATQEEIEAAASAADAHSFITTLPQGYDTLLGERGSGLSGGQRQRIAVARMLLKNPPILVLDEATSNLDPESELGLQESLECLTEGRTVVTIAHRLLAAREADRIVVLDAGTIVESGTHQELLNLGGHYASLHAALMGFGGAA